MQLDQRNNMVRELEAITKKKKRPFGEAEEALVLSSQRRWPLEEDRPTIKEVVFMTDSVALFWVGILGRF